MTIEKAVMMALDYGPVSKNSDCFVLNLPNGSEVLFIDRDGMVDDVCVLRPVGDRTHFGGRFDNAVRAAVETP